MLLAIVILLGLILVLQVVALRYLTRSTSKLRKGDRAMTLLLTDILAKVQAEETVEQSMETLLTSINAQLKIAIAQNDQTTLQQISDALDKNVAEMQAAVVANTPAAPPADTGTPPAAPPPATGTDAPPPAQDGGQAPPATS